MIRIRQATDDDWPAILDVHRRAFGRDEEAGMADAVRSSGGFVPELSLVALANEATSRCQTQGHVLTSWVGLEGSGRSFPDTGGTELTDGNLADPNNENDPAWQAHLNLGATPLDVTVDLGSAQRVGVARSYHFQCTGCSYIRPAKVELLTSTDNITYVSRNTAAADSAVNDAGRRWRYETDLAGVTARWIRFRITAGGPWLFTSETQVFAEGAGPITLPLAHSDRIIAVSDSIGRKVTYGYDQNGRLTRVVDKLGNATGQNPLLHTWHYTYDSASTHITQVIDPDGRPRVTNTYNSEGRLVTQKDGAGNNSSFGYGPSDRPSEAVLSLALMPKWVTLCFLKGAKLTDPKKILRGSGNIVRNVRLTAPADLDDPYISRLIGEAIAAASPKFPADGGAARTVIRSISAKQRPRRPR